MEEVKEHMESMEKPIIKDDEIDLIEVAKTIWAGRKLAFKIALVFSLIGLVYAFGTKDEFEANCKLLADSNERNSSMSGFSSLAGLAGINLGFDIKSSLTPELYPEIAQSIPYLLQVVNEPIYFEEQDTTVSAYTFFKEINKPSLTSYIII